MNNFEKFAENNESRVELHDLLHLTGSQISINTMPKGTNIPFVHAHKENEEVYACLSGNGYFLINDEKIEFSTGNWIKILPNAKRQLFAESDMKYICIQTKENSLKQYTENDAVIY